MQYCQLLLLATCVLNCGYVQNALTEASYADGAFAALPHVRRLRDAGYDEFEVSSLSYSQPEHEYSDDDHHSFFTRYRRSADKDIPLHFRSFNDSYHLNVRHAPPILHPEAKIITTRGDLENVEQKEPETDCFLIGDVISHDGGTVSLSYCNYLVGTISTPSYELHIQHHEHETNSSGDSNIPLLIARRRRSVPQNNFLKDEGLELSLHHRRRKRAVLSTDITVELAVYADAEYTARMGVTDTQKRIELMLIKYNGVQMEWSRSDLLGYNVTLQIKYIHFFETNPAWLDTSTTLLSTWLSSLCSGKTSDAYDLFYMHVGTQGLDVTGRAYLNSVCNQASNCAVDNVPNPLQYVATAHEIGHNFGMLHDSDAGCIAPDVGNMGNYGAGWSTCNKAQMQTFLTNYNVACLWEENIAEAQVSPLLQGVTLVPELPGQLMSADQLCEAKYGDGFQFRQYPLLDECNIHSCVDHNQGPSYGRMYREDYIPGLYCGTGKICFKSVCQTWATAKQENLEVRAGNWGAWGEWAGCSRTCGRGVNFRRRRCDSPIPMNSPICPGDQYEAETCDSAACSDDSSDENQLKIQRASETCARLVANNIINSTNYQSTGTLYSTTKHGQCEVKCDEKGGYITPTFTRFGLMPQGTPCTAEDEDPWDAAGWPRGPGYTSMCIDGYCGRFGCDGTYNGERYDDCGVCGGDNSTCDVVSGFDNITQLQGERRILTTLPVGAFNIQFWFTYDDMRQNYLEVYTKEDAVVLASYNPINWIFITGDIPVSFASTQWHFTFNHQFLHAKGPLAEPAVIKLFQNKAFDNVGINYIYSVPESNAACTGTCENGGTFMPEMCACACPSGYTGNNCSFATSCASVFCLQEKPRDESTCQCQCGDNSYKSRCTGCTYPFTGVNCGTCKVSSCLNGGVFNSTTCRCECPPPFGGLSCEATCEDVVDDCETRVSSGQCQSNNEFMEQSCMLSCGLCNNTTTALQTTLLPATTETTTEVTTTIDRETTTAVSDRWRTLSVSWCHPNTGSSGHATTKCTKLPEFNDYQLATCMTSSEVSNRTPTSRCADDCRSYCILSCMVENNGITSGNVTSDCQCDPGLTSDAETGVPTWCFKPQGECKFYADCLEARYNMCSDIRNHSLTMQCNWFSEHLYDSANCTTRSWMREVRHCFQAVYVSYLEPSGFTACDGIMDRYYQSFDICLQMKVDYNYDFCDLNADDRAAIRESLLSIYDEQLKVNIGLTLTWMGSC